MPNIEGTRQGVLGRQSPSEVQGQRPGRGPPQAVMFCVHSGPKIPCFATQGA